MHDFVIKDKNEFTLNKFDEVKVYKRCKICLLEIVICADTNYSRFYLNDKEVFEKCIFEEDLKLTCEEIIIKNIIE